MAKCITKLDRPLVPEDISQKFVSIDYLERNILSEDACSPDWERSVGGSDANGEYTVRVVGFSDSEDTLYIYYLISYDHETGWKLMKTKASCFDKETDCSCGGIHVPTFYG